MVKYREILRLSSLGVSQRSIASSCGCARSTVQSTLEHAQGCGIAWPLPDEMNDAAIRTVLFPPKPKEDHLKAAIDHDRIEAELGRRGTTMMLLWREYCEQSLSAGGEPLQYSAFCKRHRDWAATHTATMHVEHKPGEQIQVDWVGDTMEVCDPDTGKSLKVYIFVACLPYSSYMYAEGFYSMKEQAWAEAHLHAFSFFGGTTPILVPDNCKTAVVKNTVKELVLNEQYRRMAEYFGCAIVPARPRRPKDKGAAEMSVGIIERQVMAPLRNRRFLSLVELNRALAKGVDAVNSRPFQKRDGSRESVFLAQEKQTLLPMPARPYEMTTRKRATVNFTYHVSFDGAWYSVPFSYVRREVEVVATSTSVRVVCDGERIAMHERCLGPKGGYVTNPDHMPDAHRDFVEWNGDRFRRRAAKIGPDTAKVTDAILSSHKIEQQSYRSCRALLGLTKTHNEGLLEQACGKALAYNTHPSYKTVKNIIATLVDEIGDDDEHAYLRGAQYYENL